MVRAEIDTALFAQFSAQNDTVPDIQSLKKNQNGSKADAKSTIQLAKLRVQIKKLEKQLSVREDAKKRLLLDDLTQQLHQLQELKHGATSKTVKNMTKKQIQIFFERLREQRPNPKTELNYSVLLSCWWL